MRDRVRSGHRPWTSRRRTRTARGQGPRNEGRPKAQRRLLDLQAIDTALNQLAHRRRTCPSRRTRALARELSALEDNRVRAQVAVDDLDRDIRRLERDIERVRARKDKDETRLTAGTGPARELEALQHEIASLNAGRASWRTPSWS